MMIEGTFNKFVDFDKDGVNNDSLELNFYIICIDGTSSPVFKTLKLFRFKNN